MQKSTERIQLEAKIIQAHENSFNIAMQMVQEEFGGNLEKALSDESFVSRMQNKISQLWQGYTKGYRELEGLEVKEGYPAMNACAKFLDEIAGHLPKDKRRMCHYPFSGVDFYWGRVFDKVIFEDISFDQEQLPSMWWDCQTYGLKRRQEIIVKLKSQGIIPESSILEFITGDAETSNANNQFNDRANALLIKGGHDFLGYLESRFEDESLEYGTIITVTPTNLIEDIEKRLAKDGYSKKASLTGTEYLIPYAMELKDVHIFLK